MNSMPKRNCPICGGNPRDMYVVNSFTISKCIDCKFVFVKESMTDDELSAYYASHADNSVYSDDENTENLSFYYTQLRREIESRIPVGRVLDVGCSNGQFLDVMRGWDCYGIEIGPEAEIAHRKYGSHILQCPVENCEWPNEFFNVITMQDSFDHMARPMEVLSRCFQLLKPGGLIVVKVHDISSLFAKISGPRYYAMIPPSHLSYFSPSTLKLALEKSGFKYGANKYISHSLFLKTIPYRFSRGVTSSMSYRIYIALRNTRIGKIRIRKNLFDIMTMFAIRP